LLEVSLKDIKNHFHFLGIWK